MSVVCASCHHPVRFAWDAGGRVEVLETTPEQEKAHELTVRIHLPAHVWGTNCGASKPVELQGATLIPSDPEPSP